MNKKIFFFALISIIAFVCLFTLNTNETHAKTLPETIDDQLENIDLSELEDLLNSINDKPENFNFVDNLYAILKGEYNFNYDSLLSYVINVLIIDIGQVLPSLICIVAIAIISSILNNLKSNFMSQGTTDIIFFVCFLGVILVLGVELVSIYNKTKNIIQILSKLGQIMSPIILTLMIASGGTVSASVYKPAVAFLSGGVISIFSTLVLPLIALTTIFTLSSSLSTNIKFNKFAAFTTSAFKWIIGLIVTIFGLFLTVQGITCASFDGISIRATKFAISNSVPIIGGFLKDGFDLVVAGSILIKNAVGLVSVFALFYIILSPVLYMVVFSLLLKLVAGIIETMGDSRISDCCYAVSKTITYLIISILMVGLMLFIMILLMIFSANALI